MLSRLERVKLLHLVFWLANIFSQLAGDAAAAKAAAGDAAAERLLINMPYFYCSIMSYTCMHENIYTASADETYSLAIGRRLILYLESPEGHAEALKDIYVYAPEPDPHVAL